MMSVPAQPTGSHRRRDDDPLVDAAVPPVVAREQFEAQLKRQIVREKALTRLGDTVSAARRRLPMVAVENYAFEDADGPRTLVDLFGPHRVLVLQHFMFAPDWEAGCPSCTWAVDTLPRDLGRLDEAGISFGLVSQAPVAKLEAYRRDRAWGDDITWVSCGATTYHTDWQWLMTNDSGEEGLIPGYSYYLLHEGRPYLTYTTRNRGTEAHSSVVAFMDRAVYGRREQWEDSPEGWPQQPTYG